MNSITETNSDQNKQLARILWTITAMLLGFLCWIQLGFMLCLLTTRTALLFVLPLAFGLSLWIGDRLGQRLGLIGHQRSLP